MKIAFLLMTGAILPKIVLAADLPVLNATNGFGRITGVARAAAKVEDGKIVISDIGRDHELHLKVKPFFAAEATALDIRYRAEGSAPSGGQLYYARGTAGYAGVREWKIPPLVADGKWRTLHLTTNDIVHAEDWLSSGILDHFRLDITDSPGGRIEIGEVAFKKVDVGSVSSANGKLGRNVRKDSDADAWPTVLPETWRGLPAERIRPVNVECKGGFVSPAKARAGELVTLSFDYAGETPEFPVQLNVSYFSNDSLRCEDVVWAGRETFRRIGGEVWRIECPCRLPVCLDSCRLTVRVDSPHFRCISGVMPSAHLEFLRMRNVPNGERPLVASVEKISGSPQFVINGRPTYVLWGANARPALHSKAPLNFVTVWNNSSAWWPDGKRFDPSIFDLQAERHLKMYPNAWFVWDLSIYPPLDWRMANPDELARDEQGRVNNTDKVNFSFASKKAIADMGEMMEKAIRYLEQSPYANRIVGYRINSGNTVEWLGWRPSLKDTELDFSPVAKTAFAEYLREFYPDVKDVSVPTFAERTELDAPYSVVWDQMRHLRTVAYHSWYSRQVAQDALTLCRRAKKLVGGQKLVGTYYGYVMTLMEFAGDQMRAHYATKTFLDEAKGSVDFLMSPQGYCFGQRGLGDAIVDMKPFATLRDHCIVSVIEDDTRTHNNYALGGFQQTKTEEQTVNLLRRNMGVSLCRGMPFYTYAITSGAEFDFPKFVEDATALRQAGERAIAVGARRNAEIAFVVSEEMMKSVPNMLRSETESFAVDEQVYGDDGKVSRHFSASGAPLLRDVFGKSGNRLARIGAPVDFRLAEDLADNPGDYKLYVFSSCLKYDQRIARAVGMLQQRKCIILWSYAPGYMDASGNAVENMKRMTGIPFVECREPLDVTVTCSDGMAFGKTGHVVTPRFSVTKADEIIGRYANGDPAVVRVRTGAAESYFCGTYRLELSFLRMMAKRSGVHIYSDSTDPMEANSHLISLHARFAGNKRIVLPHKATVYDVFNRRIVAENVKEFKFDAPLHSSWLFFLKP